MHQNERILKWEGGGREEEGRRTNRGREEEVRKKGGVWEGRRRSYF